MLETKHSSTIQVCFGPFRIETVAPTQVEAGDGIGASELHDVTGRRDWGWRI